MGFAMEERDGPGAASVAQLAEQLICNQPVVGSNPSAGSLLREGVSEKRDRRKNQRDWILGVCPSG